MTIPQFIERDPDKITRELVTQYEKLSGRTLYPAQLERLLINVIAYRETLVREAIQDAATQNLVKYARAPMLDELGVLVGCTRLPATSAQTKLRFTLSNLVAVETHIPVGTRVESSNGDVVFSTIEPLTLLPNNKTGDVWATCETAGSIGNGWLAGTINRVIDEISNVAAAVNITQTEGGSDAEPDDHYRARIMLAPETFSVAGSVEAYKYHAMSSHPDIVDVAVESPNPGEVVIYPLTLAGLPSESVKAAVYKQCSDRKVRPLTDLVSVTEPEAKKYSVTANLTLYQTADVTSTIENATAALTAWIHEKAAVLGQDIVPSQIIAALSVEGVYQVELTSPTETMVVLPRQWPLCEAYEVRFAGTSEG